MREIFSRASSLDQIRFRTFEDKGRSWIHPDASFDILMAGKKLIREQLAAKGTRGQGSSGTQERSFPLSNDSLTSHFSCCWLDTKRELFGMAIVLLEL